MVNGQTGKMVGAVPIEKKVWRDICIWGTGLSVLFTFIFCFLLETLVDVDGPGEEMFQIIGVILVEAVSSVCVAFKSLASYKKSQQLTTATEIRSYASDRQGGKNDIVSFDFWNYIRCLYCYLYRYETREAFQ